MSEEKIKEMYITNNKPKDNSLKSCLENLSEEALDDIIVYNTLLDEHDNFDGKDDKVDFLSKNIFNNFENRIGSVPEDELKELEKIANNQKTKVFCEELVSKGYLYGYYDNKQIEYIFPKELLEKYHKIDVKEMKRKNEKEKVELLIRFSLMANGVVEIKALSNFLNDSGLKISEKELYEIFDEMELSIIDDKYYTYNDDCNEIIDERIAKVKTNPNQTYNFIDTSIALVYISTLYPISKKIAKIKNPEIENKIMLLLFSKPFDEFKTLLKEKFNLNKKLVNEIIDYIEPTYKYIKTWYLDGLSLNEIEMYELCKKIYLKKKPKNNSLMECLKVLNNDSYLQLALHYNLDNPRIDQLAGKIMDNYQKDYDETLLFFSVFSKESKDLRKTNFLIESNFLEKGYIFAIEENNEYYYIVPDEFIISNGENNTCMDNRSLIYSYVIMNGLIEIDVLLEILKKNHNLDITKKQLLNDYVDDNIRVIDNKYLGMMDFEDDEITLLNKLKKQNTDYKIVDFDYGNNINEFYGKIANTIENEKEQDLLMAFIIFTLSMNIYNEENFDDFCINKKVKHNTIESLKKIVKEYKNKVPIWIYNGYSINEKNKMKKKKVGRNDPCPCGSGKKYKKCCGR